MNGSVHTAGPGIEMSIQNYRMGMNSTERAAAVSRPVDILVCIAGAACVVHARLEKFAVAVQRSPR